MDYQRAITNLSFTNEVKENGDIKLQNLSNRLGDLQPTSISWLAEYGVGVPEAISREVVSTESGDGTVFLFKEIGGRILLAQTRNHRKPQEGKKNLKYITYGKPESVLPIYYVLDCNRRSNCLVLVEDCVSAIKVARLSDSMPVLGSDLSLRKLSRLTGLYGRFRVWLDGNMYDQGCRMADRLQMMGCEAKAIYTELDPKCYSDEEICNFLDIGA